MTRRRAWLEILLLIAIVAVSGVAVAVLAEFSGERLPTPLLIVLQGAAILLGLSLLLKRATQSWRDLGLRSLQGRDLARALLVLGAALGANFLFLLAVYLASPGSLLEHMSRLQGVAAILADGLPAVTIAATMLFVGVYEELTARGFLLNRCLTAIDGVWAPVLLSSALFGLGHFYQGWIGVTQTALVGAVFAAFTLRWATLWPAILAHAMLNSLSVAALAGSDSPGTLLVFPAR